MSDDLDGAGGAVDLHIKRPAEEPTGDHQDLEIVTDPMAAIRIELRASVEMR